MERTKKAALTSQLLSPETRAKLQAIATTYVMSRSRHLRGYCAECGHGIRNDNHYPQPGGRVVCSECGDGIYPVRAFDVPKLAQF